MARLPSDAATVTAHGHTLPPAALQTALRRWAAKYGRHFPWRETSDPFHLLLAELMLRRTQARQVVPVYTAFLVRYPEPAALVVAPPEDVAAALFSLGLAWRVPAFQALAQVLVERHAGQVPDRYDALIALPGVGDYVASAICCFAFDQAVILADTNTVRVAGRVFGVTTHAESRRRKPVRALLELLLDRTHPRPYTYALLDLAALICTPVAPACGRCPIQSFCKTGQEVAHATG